MVSSDYEILDWAKRRFDRDVGGDYKSAEYVEDSIDNLDMQDGGHSWTVFKSKRPNWIERDSDKGFNFREQINKDNEDYISRIQAEIDAANESELPKIEIDKDYESATQTILDDYLNARKNELSLEDTTEIDNLFDIGDIEGLKAKKYAEPKKQEYADNLAFNLVRRKIIAGKNDSNELNSLLSTIRGMEDEADLEQEILNYLDKLGTEEANEPES